MILGGLHRRRPFELALVLLFVGALAAPMIDAGVRPDSARDTRVEGHTARGEPNWDWTIPSITRFPEDYNNHFEDTWGLRDRLLHARSLVSVFCFGISPTPRMLIGKEGWWYLNDESSLAIHRGALPFTYAELELWRRELERHRDWCAARGIQWLFVLGPSKETIYPEFLPDAFAQKAPTRFEQLLEHLEQHSSAHIVDLRQALFAAKAECPPEEPLYNRLGSHWSSRGCLVAYQAILRTIQTRWPTLAPKSFDEFRRHPAPESPDNWGVRLYLPGAFALPNWNYDPIVPWRFEVGHSVLVPITQRWAHHTDTSLPRAFLLHDSFGNEIDLLLADHFSRFVWANSYGMDAESVEREKPDVLIELFVERHLSVTPPQLTLGQSAADNRARFQASTRTLQRLDVSQDPCPLQALGATRIVHDATAGGLQIETKDEAATFLLPQMPIPTDTSGVLHLSVDSPVKTTWDLLYLREPQTVYVRGNDFELPLEAGRNEIYFRFRIPDLRGRLRVRPRAPGKYVLHEVELRSIDLD